MTTALKDEFLLPPSLWADGKFPSAAEYNTILRRGRLFYSLDIEEPSRVGPAIAMRPCNLLYHTAISDHRVILPGGGWSGFARNELLLKGVERERQYIDSLHAAGIPVIVYQNDNNFDSSQFDKSEIAEMAAELEPFTWAFSKPGRQFACTNKPGWRGLLSDRLKIRIGDYGADGVFWDNCTPFIHCRCEVCQESYRNTTGRSLHDDMGRPETVVADMRVFEYVGAFQRARDLPPVEDETTMRYLEWRIERAIDFYRTMRQAVERTIGRHIIHTSNSHIGIAEHNAVVMSGVFDMVFSEDGFTAPPHSNAFNLRLGSAMLRGEGKDEGCPFIITRVMESAPTAAMVATLSAEGRALGGQADFWDFNYRDDVQLAAAARRIRDFHRRHTDTLYAIESDFNDIAILYSWRSDLWTSAADSPSKMAAALLEDLNQPFDILLGDRPPEVERLNNYRLLIVPHVEVISEKWFETIQHFLDRGGHVVSTGDAVRLDEGFNRRERTWSGEGYKHLSGRVEKDYARSRKAVGLHSGFKRPTGPWPDAINRALPSPSLRLETTEPLLTLNHTRFGGGEAVHVVNRYCNVFPRIPTTPRTGLVLRICPAHPVARVTWISPDAEEMPMEYEMLDTGLRIALPQVNVMGVVRMEYVAQDGGYGARVEV